MFVPSWITVNRDSLRFDTDLNATNEALFIDALMKGLPLHFVTSPEMTDEMFDVVGVFLQENGFRMVEEEHWYPQQEHNKRLHCEGHKLIRTLWVGDSGVIYLNNHIQAKLFDGDIMEKLITLTTPFVVPSPPEKEKQQGSFLKALVMKHGGITVRNIGWIEEKILPDNYSPEVVARYQKAITDLMADVPTGRVVIIDGPTGTGKTHLVKNIMTEIEDGTFVLLPPSMVAELGGPGLLPVLLENKSLVDPLILILEDADALLAARGDANLDSLSTILNLGDGLLGSALDVRIILTTNTPIKQIDQALLRPGRLSVHIKVDRLLLDQGTAVLLRLCPDLDMETAKAAVSKFCKDSNGTVTLAEIYQMARDL